VNSNGPVQFFGWEDLTRSSSNVTAAEMNFHDMVFTIEGATLTPLADYVPEDQGGGGQGGSGVVVVPEPTAALLGTVGMVGLLLRRRRADDVEKPAGR
jgi:hypothetical protein